MKQCQIRSATRISNYTSLFVPQASLVLISIPYLTGCIPPHSKALGLFLPLAHYAKNFLHSKRSEFTLHRQRFPGCSSLRRHFVFFALFKRGLGIQRSTAVLQKRGWI